MKIRGHEERNKKEGKWGEGGDVCRLRVNKIIVCSSFIAEKGTRVKACNGREVKSNKHRKQNKLLMKNL
jgi:hypothetical protein